MNQLGKILFHVTAWSAAAAAGVMTIAVILSVYAWRRSGGQAVVGWLELFRLGLILSATLLLMQPEWLQQYRPIQRPVIAVLCDGSPSMDTRDVRGEGNGAPVKTRREVVSLLADPHRWESLKSRFDVVIETFSPAPDASATNLYDPLVRTLERHPTLRAVVLLSDGDWNEGPSPLQAAARLRLAGVPIYAIPVGAAERLPDLELVSFEAPTFAVVGKSVRLSFAIENYMPRDITTTVSLTINQQETIRQEVRLPAMSRTSDAVIWKPEQAEDVTVKLQVNPVPGEAILENNSLEAPISIRNERLKVLVVESRPRWEYRYLRNALSRDPGVELSCLLFHPELDKQGGGSRDYIKEFPRSIEELSPYDVVFLGDVGMEPGQLTWEQCQWLAGLVQQQAAGLVFLPGLVGKQFSLLESPLGNLYPVVLDASQPSGWGSAAAGHLELTEAGRRSLLTRLADTPEETAEVWANLPGFQWYAPVVRAKAGSDVLAVHAEVANNYGRIPLMVARTYGVGKVLFMGTDGAWRWRRGVEDKYHYRFWGQVVRWMAYARHMARGETMRLYYWPDQPQLRQNVILQANVMDASGEPVQQGEVTAVIMAPSGRVDVVPFVPEGNEWGTYRGQYACGEPGEHRLTLRCRETGATLQTKFFVQRTLAEHPGKPARPEVLDQLARLTEGSVTGWDNLAELVHQLASLPEPPLRERRIPLWAHPVTMFSLLALFSLFWIARKGVGLL